MLLLGYTITRVWRLVNRINKSTMKATEIHEDFAVKKLPKTPVLGNPKNRGKRRKKDK